MNKLIGLINFKKDPKINLNNVLIKNKKFTNYNSYNVEIKGIENDEVLSYVKFDCQTKYLIVFDGYLTNKEELICKLKTMGYKLTSNTFSEVCLDLYIHYKEKCLDYLKGAFALLIYDGKTVFMASDKLAIKNFYYFFNNDYLIFANKLKLMFDSKLVKPLITKEGILELTSLFPSSSLEKTLFKDIKKLRSGYFYLVNNLGLTKSRYYALDNKVILDSYNEALSVVKDNLYQKINYLNDNYDLGYFLSGGIDSSITSLVGAKFKQNIDTYFLEYQNSKQYFKENKYQKALDKNYARIVSKALKTNHHEFIIDSKTLFSYLRKAMIAREKPGMGDIDASLLWLLEKIKKEHRYLVSGECSDEINGGYPWFKELKDFDYFPWIRNINERQKLLNKDYQDLNLSKYLKDVFYDTLKDYKEANYLEVSERNSRKITYLNLYMFMPQLIDRQNSLASYLNMEVFSPFGDIDLIEYIYNLPLEYKYYNSIDKRLLKDCFKELPSKIILRSKNPYPKTYDPSYEKLVKNKLKKYLANQDSFINKIYDKDKLLNLIAKKDDNLPYYGQLMSNVQFFSFLIQLEMWSKYFKVEIEKG